MALRALAADLLDLTILAPELKLVSLSMSRRPQPSWALAGTKQRSIASSTSGMSWSPEMVRSSPCDPPVLALGARAGMALRGGPDLSRRSRWSQLPVAAAAPAVRGPGQQVGVVKLAGASSPLPLYDLALLTAAECGAHERSGVELSLITPEEPLGNFGKTASAAIGRLLEDQA